MSASSLFTNWLSNEPMASAAMFIAALLLFGASFGRIWSAAPAIRARIWQVMALTMRIGVFLTLLWCLHFLLTDSGSEFSKVLADLVTGGPAGRTETKQLYTNWGAWVSQTDLGVQHFVEKEYVEEISQGADKPLLYRPYKRSERLDQESITSFDGTVRLHLVDPKTAKYELNANYVYTVANQAEVETVAEFSFPLTAKHLFENLAVSVDGQAVAWKIERDRLNWKQALRSKQTCRVEISYATRGIESFNYSIINPREIRNYSLTIITDSDAINTLTSLESNAIHRTLTHNTGPGYTLNWKIDRAIMAPMLGVVFVIPARPVLSKDVLDILPRAARGLVLLLSLAVISLVICGLNVELWRLALIGGIFAAQFLGVLAIYPAVNNYVLPILLLGALALIIDRLILGRLPRLPLALILIQVVIFGIAYPFSGLLPGERERNALDGAVQIGMIIYIFGLTLYTRVRSKPISQP
jgi:hypothetical protein